jgi:aminocarboxymuconate-semialdehyde decarboxylase
MAVSKSTKKAKRRTSTPASGRRTKRSSRPFVIDVHCHVRVPEVIAFAKGHVVEFAPLSDGGASESDLRKDLERAAELTRMSVDFKYRLQIMDRMGVDMQVLAAGIGRHYTYWAEPEVSLKMERLLNDRLAEFVAIAPERFVALGGVPLQAPELAAQELTRCVKELGLRGVQISSNAHTMELGDPKLRPFWAQAEKLGAAVLIHPAGVTSDRFRKWQLWNSVGQPLEEAMAMASLFYEGTLDAFPKLKICIVHGGGYLPYAAGRVDRNYHDKAHTRVNMKRSPSEYMRRSFYYDSCTYNLDVFEFLVHKVGASRIVMGSDYASGESDPVGFVRKARGLSAADKRAILGGNAAKMLGLSI